MQFDKSMNKLSFDNRNFIVTGTFSGRHVGTFAYSAAQFELQFTSDRSFAPGEVVTAVATTSLTSADGFPLAKPYVFQFTIATGIPVSAFEIDSTYSCNAYPTSIVAADLDNDLDLDLFTANSGSDVVLVYYNDGNGIFTPAPALPAGSSPRCAVAGDFNGDGYTDIVASNQGVVSDTVWTMSVLLNDGAGGFLSHRQDTLHAPVLSLATGDFNGDGYPDVILINENDNEVTVRINSGDGHFGNEIIYAAAVMPTSATIVDLDNDGDLDAAIGCYGPDAVQIFKNNGYGSFTLDGEYDAHHRPWSIQSADLNADGYMDLAVACWGDTVTILLNDHSGSFPTKDGIEACDMPRSVFPSDIDGDGDIDLATVCQYDDYLFLMSNLGSGTFSGNMIASGGSSPQAVVLADLNGDMAMDAAIANWNSYDMAVHLTEPPSNCGDADGSGGGDIDDVIFIVNYIFTGGPAPEPMEIANVNCLDDVDIDDVVSLVGYIFLGGAAPCDPDDDGTPDC